MKKCICILLVATLALLPILTASATAIAPMASHYFNTYGTTFVTGDDGVITFRLSVTAVQISKQLGVSTFEIQRSSGGSWSSVTSWLTGSVGNDVVTHSFAKKFYGTPGEKYRVHCFYVCENDLGYSTQEYFSGSITARK